MTKALKFIIFGLITASFSFIYSQQLDYPPARQVDQTDDYHGIKVADPYRWMEKLDSDELQKWIKAQDDLLENFLDTSPARNSVQKRISELIRYDSFTNPTGFVTPFVAKRENRYFFIKTSAGESRSVLYVREDSETKVLFDAAKDEMNLVGYVPSPDGRYVVLHLSSGDRWLTYRILDVKTRRSLSDVLTDAHRLGGVVSWMPDGEGLFYTKFEKIEQDGNQPPVNGRPKIYFHTIGDIQAKDKLIYEEPDNPKTLFSYQTTADGRFLIISAVEGSSLQNRILCKDLKDEKGQIKTLLKADANYTFLGSKDSEFWFYTTYKAQRGRVIKLDLSNPDKKNWTEIVPETEAVISAGSSVGGNALGMFGSRIVLLYMKDSNPIVKVFDLAGKLEKEFGLPSGGTVWGGFSGSQNDDVVLYEYLGLTSPATFYRIDLSKKQNEIFLQPDLKFDPKNYEIKQIFYTSKDKTRVPMFIAYRKGIKLDGSNPALMYGYGAFGWTAFMWYQPHIITWLERGGIYAVPGIRGGGEYGEKWHQAGVKTNKQNSVDDYIAAAEWLVKNKYTNSSKLVINGGSASSAVAAAAILQRPKLFGAAVIDIPILDMLRFDKFTNGRYWLAEFGSVENLQEFKTLHTYSPYHNIKEKTCYPPTLIMVGEKDETAVPSHAYKFTAHLQNAQDCQNPILMKLMPNTGHNFGSTPEQRVDSWTDELTFLEKVLELQNK